MLTVLLGSAAWIVGLTAMEDSGTSRVEHIAMIFLVVILWAPLTWSIFAAACTRLTGHGIRRPTVRGARVLPWREVRRVYWRGPTLVCESRSDRVLVNAYWFGGRAALARFVDPFVPPTAVRNAPDRKRESRPAV
jgi:hypothetical protein